jgi:CheY-like chemotaxis protein
MSAHRILVVDDNATNLKLIGDILEMEGYQVARATSAENAHERVRAEPFDLILMDVGLPGMDGLTFTRLLKSDPAYAHIPIVAVTAFAMLGDDRKAYEAGCNGYISKPINTRTLAAQVAGYIEQAEQQQGG